jgi:hypothetical protein
MPFASGRGIKFDVPLSQLAVSAFADASNGTGLIGDMIFPAVPVERQSDVYYIIEKDAFLRNYGNQTYVRAPGTNAKKVEWTVSSNTFYATNYALVTEQPLEDQRNADRAVALEANAIRLLTGQLRIAQELRIASLITSISNVGSGVALTGADKFSDTVNSDPIAVVNTGHAFIQRATGLLANVAIMDFSTYQTLRRHPVLLDLFKYTQGGQLNDAEIANAFSVEKLLVGQGVYNTQRESVSAAASMVNIWGNNLVLARVDPGAVGLQTATLGLRMQWTPEFYPAEFGVQRSVEANAGQRKVEIFEAGHYQDEKVVARDFAYAITGTL